MSSAKQAISAGLALLLIALILGILIIHPTRKRSAVADRSSANVPADRSTPRGTLLAMVDAMQTGDSKSFVENYLFTTDEELKLKANLENVVDASARFRQAVAMQFGAMEEKSVAANLPLVMPREMIGMSEERIDGDSAEVVVGGKGGRPAQFRKVNGEWKLTPEGLFHLSPAVQNEMFSRLARSLDETTAEIAQNKFSTAAAAMHTMKERAR